MEIPEIGGRLNSELELESFYAANSIHSEFDEKDFDSKSEFLESKLVDISDSLWINCCFCSALLEVEIPTSSESRTFTVYCEACTSLSAVTIQPFVEDAKEHRICEDLVYGEETHKPFFTDFKASSSHGELTEIMKQETMSMEKDMEPNQNKFQSKSVAAKKSRSPSLYNLFIRDEIPRLKAANPSMDHREAFKIAAKNWASSARNVRGIHANLFENCARNTSLESYGG